jgi:hypothetical protein
LGRLTNYEEVNLQSSTMKDGNGRNIERFRVNMTKELDKLDGKTACDVGVGGSVVLKLIYRNK